MFLGNTVSTNVEANKDYFEGSQIKGDQKLKYDDKMIIEAEEEIHLNTEEKITEFSFNFELDKESLKTVWNGAESITEEKLSSIEKINRKECKDQK